MFNILKTATVLFLFLLRFDANAQNYQSVFGQNSTVWNDFYEVPDAGLNDQSKVIGDTVINNAEYKILHSYSQLSGYEFLFLREDSTHARLYSYDSATDSDQLVMDLNQVMGDTIEYMFDEVIIDSIYYLNDLKHLRTNWFLFEWPVETRLEYVEGAGPTSGFNFYLNGILLCHSRDEVINFQLPDSTYDCDYTWLGSQDLSANCVIALYPNPSFDRIFIELSQNYHRGYFEVSDLRGSLFLKGNLVSGTNEISTSDLPSGVFSVRVFDEEKLVSSRIFVRQ